MKFKMGDLIKTLIDKEDDNSIEGHIFIPKGSLGHVCEVYSNNCYLIEFGKDIHYPYCLIFYNENEITLGE